MQNDSFNYAPQFVLLGAQRDRPRLQEVLEQCQIDGPVGLVAAGWEEDEGEDGWVRNSIRNQLVNSRLYEHAESLFQEDPEVLRLLRQRQDQLREWREVYQRQIQGLSSLARELVRRVLVGQAQEFAPQLDLTVQQLRDVDVQHLELVSATIREYDQRIAPESRSSLLRYRQRVLDEIRTCQALLMAGGHVGVLLNRLKLSRLLHLLRLPVVAWSGGAMTLGSQICFFHQSAPNSTPDIEFSRYGLNWFQGLQIFPRAKERLALQDQIEMALLARRVPSRVLLLDPAAQISFAGTVCNGSQHVRLVQTDGQLVEWQP